MTKDKILAALPSLSKPDLRAIAAATGALLAGGHHPSPQAPSGPQGWLFEALAGALNRPLTHDRFSVSAAGQHFKQNAPIALAFMQKAFGATAMGNKITALAIMRSLLSLLISDLLERGVPITPGTLASNLGRLDEVFDRAYPGYLTNGIASLVLRAIKRKQ